MPRASATPSSLSEGQFPRVRWSLALPTGLTQAFDRKGVIFRSMPWRAVTNKPVEQHGRESDSPLQLRFRFHDPAQLTKRLCDPTDCICVKHGPYADHLAHADNRRLIVPQMVLEDSCPERPKSSHRIMGAGAHRLAQMVDAVPWIAAKSKRNAQCHHRPDAIGVQVDCRSPFGDRGLPFAAELLHIGQNRRAP